MQAECAGLVAGQSQDRAVDDEPRRLDVATEHRAQAETCRHFREARQFLARGQRQPDILRLQVELMRVAIDADTDTGDRDANPGARALQCLLDIRHETVELDRALQQPPDAGYCNKYQDPGDAAEPYQQPMGVMTDMLRRCPSRMIALGTPQSPHFAGPGLTGTDPRATVVLVAGLAR